MYLQRWLTPFFKKNVKNSPVTVLTGARHVGKSTLLLNEFKNKWRYISFDDFDILEMAKRNPFDLLQTDKHIIIDEIQLAPEILKVIKQIVDKDNSYRFILSGSANLLLMAKVAESLAGRAQYKTLRPVTQGEISGYPPSSFFINLIKGKKIVNPDKIKTKLNLAKRIWIGGMPEMLKTKNIDAILSWRDGYIATYLERDLRQLTQIKNLVDFRRFMMAIAIRSGKILNISEVARDIGLSQPTASRYMNILEISGLAVRINAYKSNRGSRIIKAPKVVWLDTGLASHLAGFFSSDSLMNSREWGGMLESFVFQHLQTICDLITPKSSLYYWRTRSGVEVDFVIEHGRDLIAVEIKASKNVGYYDIKGIENFEKEFLNMKLGIIIYSGDEFIKLTDKIFAVPLKVLLEGEMELK